MAKPWYFTENFFNDIIFPGHTISAITEVAGNEAVLVGTGRRELNYWTPTAFNLQAYIGIDLGVNRTADCVAIDRRHNLEGQTISIRRSSNNWSGSTTVFTATVPTATSIDQALADSPGVYTEEGSYIFRFTPATDRYWRLYIEAGGANYRPQIPGLYLGEGYEPLLPLDLPYDDEAGEVFFDQVVSSTAWVARTNAAARRRGQCGLKMQTAAEYLTARYNIIELFKRKITPMWIVYDQDNAERTVLAITQPGRYTFPRANGWFQRQTLFEWVEHEPKLT